MFFSLDYLSTTVVFSMISTMIVITGHADMLESETQLRYVDINHVGLQLSSFSFQCQKTVIYFLKPDSPNPKIYNNDVK